MVGTLECALFKVLGLIPRQFQWVKSIQSYILVLNETPTNGWWDWIPSFKKNKKIKIKIKHQHMRLRTSSPLKRTHIYLVILEMI